MIDRCIGTMVLRERGREIEVIIIIIISFSGGGGAGQQFVSVVMGRELGKVT